MLYFWPTMNEIKEIGADATGVENWQRQACQPICITHSEHELFWCWSMGGLWQRLEEAGKGCFRSWGERDGRGAKKGCAIDHQVVWWYSSLGLFLGLVRCYREIMRARIWQVNWSSQGPHSVSIEPHVPLKTNSQASAVLIIVSQR
jgi:hypothetical protein